MKRQPPPTPVSFDALPDLTSADACALIKISRPTLHRYVRRGLLNPLRLPGGRLRFKRADLIQLLA